MNITQEVKNQDSEKSFITSSSLNEEEIGQNLEIIANKLNEIDSHISFNSRVGEMNQVYNQIHYTVENEKFILPIKYWGSSSSRHSSRTYKGMEIHFSTYSKKRIMFSNFNKITTMYQEIADYMKERIQTKMTEKINCYDQRQKFQQWTYSEIRKIHKEVFKVEEDKWSHIENVFHNENRTVSAKIEFTTPYHVKAVVTMDDTSFQNIKNAKINISFEGKPQEIKDAIDEVMENN